MPEELSLDEAFRQRRADFDERLRRAARSCAVNRVRDELLARPLLAAMSTVVFRRRDLRTCPYTCRRAARADDVREVVYRAAPDGDARSRPPAAALSSSMSRWILTACEIIDATRPKNLGC